MERRNFIKHSLLTGIALGAVPALAMDSSMIIEDYPDFHSVLLWAHNVVPQPQVRHGLVQLPQAGLRNYNQYLRFNSLRNVDRQLLLMEGGAAEESTDSFEITSISFEDAAKNFASIQVGKTSKGWEICSRDGIYTVDQHQIEGRLQEVLQFDEPIGASLWMGKIAPGETISVAKNAAASRYFTILEGEPRLNGFELPTYGGYGISGESLHLQSTKEATVLMLEWS